MDDANDRFLARPAAEARIATFPPFRHQRISIHFYDLVTAVQNVAANHLFKGTCQNPAEDIIKRLEVLRHSTSRFAGTGKEYWARSAALLGIYENEELGYLLFRKQAR